MTKISIIHQTIETLQQLPEDKVVEVAEFAAFLLKKQEEWLLQKGIEILVSESESFAFLEEEEDLYTLEDLKERYYEER
jgi:sulfur transfer complex TusBCD TusB component (DsrH family)